MGETATSTCSPYSEIRARWLHIVLFVVAAFGWLIFILACAGGPAWSPDGSQILFAYRDVENSRTSVALYDRTSGAIITILTQPALKEGDMALRPVWQKDGQRALVGIYRAVPNDSSEASCELVSIPVKSSVPLQVYNLGHMEGCANAFPDVGGKIYFGGRDLRWVDLKTGEVGAKEFKPGIPESEGLVFSDGAGQIYYQRKATRKTTAEEETGREIGRVQPEDGSLNPVLTIWDEEAAAHGVSDLYPDLWLHGSILALIGTTKESESDKIVLAEENKGITRTITADLGSGPYRLGNLIWAPDGSRFYASVITTGNQKDTLNYGIAEIPIDVV